MAYATARNRALKTSWRRITGVVGTQEWYTDGYFAVPFPIFDGYKNRKSDEVVNIGSRMESIFPHDLLSYFPATPSEATAAEQRAIRHEDRYDNAIALEDINGHRAVVNERYHALVMDLYPEAIPCINTEVAAPVLYRVNNETMGLIMPVVVR